MEELLQQDNDARAQVDVLTEIFAADPDGPLNGSTHAALQSQTASENRYSTRDVNIVATSVPRSSTNPIVLRDEVNSEEKRFRTAMKEYEKNAKEKYKTGVSLDDTHSIGQLWDVIDDAIDHYTSQGQNGLWGKIRIAFRKLGDGNEAIQGWLGLLPDQSEYLSIVCGGLKLVLKAAAQMRKVAESVLSALQQIPTIFNSIQRVLNIFQESTKLQELSDAIYQSTLAALGHMLGYLRRKSLSKVVKALIKQQAFESDLSKKIEEMAKARDDFNTEAELCHKEALKKLHDASERNGHHIGTEIQHLSRIVAISTKEQERSSQMLKDYLDLMDHRLQDVTQELKEVKQLHKHSASAMDSLLRILRENPAAIEHAYQQVKRLPDNDQNVDLRPMRRSSLLRITYEPKARPSQVRRALLQQLDYDPDSPGHDVASNYRRGLTLSREEQERSLFAIRSAALASWVKSEQSSVLVINSNSNNVKPNSGLSFLCARLVYGLDKIRFGNDPGSNTIAKPEIIPIHFFCGKHLKNDDSKSWESPTGIVNSLLAQLLAQNKDIDLSQSAHQIGKIDSSDVDDVFELFRLSLKKLPSHFMVFCVVDGASFYVNNDEVSKSAKGLLAKLLKIVRNTKKSRKWPVFKLLLTTPSRLRMDEIDGLDNGRILNIPKTLPDTGGFTSMKWDSAMGQQLEDIEDSQE